MADSEQNGAARAPTPSLTLGELIAKAASAIRERLPDKIWVEAVVLDARPTRAGLSLELVEPFADETNNAFLKCLLGAHAKRTIEATLGLPLDAATLKGVHARLLLKPTFHPRYHLEGQVVGLDPALVQSLVARRLEMIRETLRAENLFGAQVRLATPDEITAVAVIHPERSAGWADVQAELEHLQSRGILALKSYPVPFEGSYAAAAIGAAINDVSAHSRCADLILIVRGGGAAAGLAVLANLALARVVCRCPVPIVTGIGHASDRTLLDDLAWRAADTPSKALGLVKSILKQRASKAIEDHRSIIEAMHRLVMQTLQPLLTASSLSLLEGAQRLTSSQAAALRERAHGVERHVIAFRGEIAATQTDLDRLASQLLVTAPAVPRKAGSEAKVTYADVVRLSRARLPGPDLLTGLVTRSANLITAFLDKEDFVLGAGRLDLERTIRGRLGDEAARLASAFGAAQTLDVASTLQRGFVLPLDAQRRIIRSAGAARTAAAFELLFTDGSVACQPVGH